MFKKMMFLLLASCSVVNMEMVVAKTRHYGPNIIGLDRVTNNTGTGVGIGYQRIMGKGKRLSLGLQLAYCLGNGSRSGYAVRRINIGGEVRQPQMFNIEPAVRFYPFKTNGIVRYAIGGMLLIGFGEGKDDSYIFNGVSFSHRSITGLLMLNSLHIQPIPQLRISLECGVGLCSDNNYQAIPLAGQASAGLAWRW